MKKTLFLPAMITAIVVFNGCNKNDAPADQVYQITKAEVALDWYKLQLRILLERNSSLNGVYFGYIGIGLYESVRYEFKNSVSLSTKLNQMPEMPTKENNKDYNWEVSANSVMAAMLRSFNTGLTPANLASIDSLENAYNQKLAATITSPVFTLSQTFGRSIANAIHEWYLTDNFNPSNAGYVPPVFAGAWVPTPPAFANGIMPFVSNARTFVSSNATAVAPAPMPYAEDPNAGFYKMVKNVYEVSQALTADQKNIALFWFDQGNGTGYTPSGHHMSIVTQVLEQAKATLALAAETYAKAGMAEHDATVVCFRSKYTYNLIRPVTYIRKLIDPNWLPFIPTPPHPEYPAAHALVTGSVMQAIAKVLGDKVAITDHTYDFRGWEPRTFSTLFKAGEEAGISRLYGGIHYQNSIDAALSISREVGGKAGEIKLHD